MNSLSPADFKKFPEDGARFEALVCDLLEDMNYRIIERPAIGTEGGRDILVERLIRDPMTETSERVVVQCKHYARSGRVVSDVGNWMQTMVRYHARGYLLATDTRVTENLSAACRGMNESGKWAAYWDVDDLI